MKENSSGTLSTEKILKPINNKIMKTQNTHFFQALGKAQLDNLVKEVAETVAIAPAINHNPAFGIVDLWNLERSSKRRVARRHLVY
jgi:hypothetical protein